jgi:hypothetical protein
MADRPKTKEDKESLKNVLGLIEDAIGRLSAVLLHPNYTELIKLRDEIEIAARNLAQAKLRLKKALGEE